MTRIRDYQREKVYRAEKEWHRRSPSRRLETVPEIQAYVDRICRSKWVRANVTRGWWDRDGLYRGGVEVRDGRGRRSAGYEGFQIIKVPRSKRCEAIVLHELAHFFAPNTVPRTERVASHGRIFCRTMLRLVSEFMGMEQFKELAACYRENRVRYIESDEIWLARQVEKRLRREARQAA